MRSHPACSRGRRRAGFRPPLLAAFVAACVFGLSSASAVAGPGQDAVETGVPESLLIPRPIPASGALPAMVDPALFKAIQTGLKFVHQQGVVHLADTSVKIADFGSPRNEGQPLPPGLFYVITRPYRLRAPELLLGARTACRKMDVWSFGVVCFVAYPGASFPLGGANNGPGQLVLALALVGTPSAEEL